MKNFTIFVIKIFKNMVQESEMSYGEKVEMYKVLEKEELIKLLIESNNLLSTLVESVIKDNKVGNNVNKKLKIFYYSNSSDNVQGSYVICISDSLKSAKKIISEELTKNGLVFNDKIEIKVNNLIKGDIIYSSDGDF